MQSVYSYAFRQQTRGGATPYNDPYGEAPLKRGTFFRLQVYERVGILLVEVYERGEKSAIWVCERAQRPGGGVLDISLGGEVRHGPSYPDPV